MYADSEEALGDAVSNILSENELYPKFVNLFKDFFFSKKRMVIAG